MPVIPRQFNAQKGDNLAPGIMPDQLFEEVTFSLAGSSLYLYTGGLSKGLARTLNMPDETKNLFRLIEQFCDLPRQERLKRFADEASKFDSSFDDLTILLIEDDSKIFQQ